MKKFLSDNWIILFIGVAFTASTILAIRNNSTIKKNLTIQRQTELIKQHTKDILTTTMHGIDLGVRGFGLTHDNKLLAPYDEAIKLTPSIFTRLDSALKVQKYSDLDKLNEVREEVDHYIKHSNKMLQLAREDNMAVFTELLKEDKGYDVWKKYSAFATPLFEYEDNLNEKALLEYRNAMRSNLILQLAILFIALPMLLLFVVHVKKERRARQALMSEVEKTDKTHIFNAGESKKMTAEEINAQSISHVRQASEFIQSMAGGNYDVEWSGLNPSNEKLNEHTLAGNLVQLRDRLRQVKREDERRNWSNEGLAKFSEIVRNHQHNGEELFIKCIAYLTKYLDAQQGSLFIVEDDQGDKHLKLAACYAFDRKKYIDKRIEIGQGMVGQAYLEGEPMLLKKVPENYVAIRSGLGDACPTVMLIVPMKYDGETRAIVEVATFNSLEEYQISFLQKAGEFLASAIVNTRTTIKMKTLLEEASMKETQMRQREEELRQNMEELQATQEELMRRQREQEYGQMNLKSA